MSQNYSDHMSSISVENIEKYLKKIRSEVGNTYKFSTTPVFLKADIFNSITDSSRIVLEAISRIRQNSKSKNTFLKANQITKNDVFGSIDFHVNGENIKIIEINMFPPAFASFIEIMELNYNELVLSSCKKCLSSGFLNRMVDTISSRGVNKKILICDYDIDNEYSLNEFKYIKKVLQGKGGEVELMSANKIKLTEDGLIKGFEDIDRIYNRLTLKTWEKNLGELSEYTKLYNSRPDLFFTNPLGWELSKKDFINSIKDEAINIGGKKAADVFLKTNLLSDYQTIEELKKDYFSRSKIVIKPIDDFGSKGVLLKPSNVSINKYLGKCSEDYIVQELCPPPRTPYLNKDGSFGSLKYDLRVVFIEEKIAGFYARVYEGGVTNFSGENGGLAPVFLIE